MEHSQLRLLATALFPGLLVFVLLFTVRTPIVHSPSYWRAPLPAQEQQHLVKNVPRELVNSAKVFKRSETSSHFIGLRSVEDPGACLKDSACRGYLTGKAKDSYNQCMARVRNYGHVKRAKDNGCQFMDGKRRGVVALASFPGSGNTWVRSLLERSTGICTGSYTCDMSLRYAGFTGEGIQSSNVVAVKTHDVSPSWANDISSHKFSSGIFLVRNPLDALVSDWNRNVANGFKHRTVNLGTHTQKAGKEYFRNNTKWNVFIHRKAHMWMEMINNWVIKSKHHKNKILVVMYEDLKNNEEVEIERMLNFLKMGQLNRNSMETTQATPTGPLQNFTTNFHRKHNSNDEIFQPFTDPQRAYVLNIIRETQRKLEQNRLSIILDVSRYLVDKAY